MIKRVSLFLLFSALSLSGLWANETTYFENLGFSADGRYFLFGQYGSTVQTKNPLAELYFINVDRNVYYPGGDFKKTYPVTLDVGEEGKSALYSLLSETQVESLRKKLGINHLLTGRQIYQVYDEEGENKDFSRKEISFEDFEKGDVYRVTLRQSVNDEKTRVVSSFFINTQLLGKNNEVLKSIAVGHPKYNRSGITSYRVAQVFVTPAERDLLFVVERENKRADGTIFYDYMIEIGKLR